MMLFRGFKSKKELKEKISNGEKIHFADHHEETSIFGNEYKGAGTYCVCMDHPKRYKFANITVDADGFITKVS